MRPLTIAFVLLAAAAPAHAEREMCGNNARYRGKTIDLDVKAADIREVFRLIADVGKVNLVVPSDVDGKVTLKLKRVPWDQVACTIAAVHHLRIAIDRNILMVTRAGATAAKPPRR